MTKVISRKFGEAQKDNECCGALDKALARVGGLRSIIYCTVQEGESAVRLGISGSCSQDDAVLSIGVLAAMERRALDLAGC